MRLGLNPAVRISFGLVSLTVSLLLIGKLLGLAPEQKKAVFESRVNLSQALAIQFSMAVQRNDMAQFGEILGAVVKENGEVRSAAVRKMDGDLLAEAGSHLANWKSEKDGRSTTTHVLVPIFRGEERWGTVEVSFSPLWQDVFSSNFRTSYLSLIFFIAVTGFGGYYFLIKRSLRELDPSNVVPGRVRAAFDVLKEGVLILDEKELIVLANDSFAEIVERRSEELIGYAGSELGWKNYQTPEDKKTLPWVEVLEGAASRVGVRLTLNTGEKGELIFIVNAAPVLDGKGNRRGVLVTFDNITELEEKNLELNKTVNQLQLTTEEVQAQNRELKFLANHDPMTQLLNRRAFTRDFYKLFHRARQNGVEMTCIMCDIDHFKAVNDNYGHATGDKVIIMVANLLKRYFQEEDLLGRYGGEEFCIVLPNIDLKQAAEIANRVRKAVKSDLTTGVQITMSFGVAALQATSQEPDELSGQADKALYVAKESGRNCVVCWGEKEIDGFTSVSDGGEAVQPLENDAVEPEVRESGKEQREEVRRLAIRLKETEQLAEKRAQELKNHGAYDPHTGLPTRFLFQDRVSQSLLRARRYKSFVVVLSISVDAVQRVNETLGYREGDMLFREVGCRLVDVLREMDTVAQLDKSSSPSLGRLGNEEIGILITELEDVNAVTWIVKRILDAFTRPFEVESNDIYATTNIGIAVSPQDGNSADILMRNAAAAKSHARKNLGENRYYYYSETINAVSIQHLYLEKQLGSAIAASQFKLFYQAKINACTGDICGMEALIRWFHPENGMVPPDRFIPVAEYSGMITVIGEWVISEACRQLRSWLDDGFEQSNIAVNVSNRQFRDENLLSIIKTELQKNGLQPQMLTIEVTESVMMESVGNSLEILQEMSDLGLNIALDDFGTGYSSLGYLKNFPVNYVKIDRSFVADIQSNEKDATMVKSIVRMAHGMGIKVTAEGVENKEQIDQLLGYGCDELQGFYFSKAVSAVDATRLLKSGLGGENIMWHNRKGV